MSTVTITLDKPIVVGPKTIRQIVLREPSTIEGIRHGEPYTIGRTADGSTFIVDNAEAIEAHLKNCIVEPEDPMLVLRGGGMELVRVLKDALFSFSLPAAVANEASAAGSQTSPTTSSSTGAAPSRSETSIG